MNFFQINLSKLNFEIEFCIKLNFAFDINLNLKILQSYKLDSKTVLLIFHNDIDYIHDCLLNKNQES